MELMLHPLVVISISDHFTRARLENPSGTVKIVGILLGMARNGKIEITNSFDIIVKTNPNTGALAPIEGEEESFLRRRLEAFLTVFPDTTPIGWYRSGKTVDPDEALVMARALSSRTDTMFAMTFDAPAAYDPNTKDIPIDIYEAELKGDVEKEQTVVLKKTPYHIMTIEAERIGVDHITKTSTTEGRSQLTVHVLGVQGAMKMLDSRIEMIRDYLKKVKEGRVPYDYEIMRKIGALHDLLLASQAQDFEQRFFEEYNDETLLTYLSSLTEGLQAMNSMVDTHVVYRKDPVRHMNPRDRDHDRGKSNAYRF